MRHLDSLRQTNSVAEYYAMFEQFSHQILLYNPAPIALRRPKNYVDTASALSLIHEKELEASHKKISSRGDVKEHFKAGSQVFSTNDKAKHPAKQEDGKRLDKSVMDEKWAALKAYG